MGFFDNWLKNRIQGQIDTLLKVDENASAPPPDRSIPADSMLPDMPEDHDASNQIGRKALVDDPYFDTYGKSHIYKHKISRISNKTLKEVSVRDWLVSAIIQCRCDTLLRFSRPEHRRFEMGFRVIKRDDKSTYSDQELQEIAAIEDFLYNCGRRDGTPADDTMLFGEFLKLVTRDALTFGHVAIEKVKTRRGGLHRFRPIPAESTYLIDKKQSKTHLEQEIKTQMALRQQSLGDNDPRKDQQVNSVPVDYYKYVQVGYDMRPVAMFGDEDMIFKLFNMQNFADSGGYCYSPLELAIINITNHMNVESYNSAFFTHGYASRGVLHLKGTVTQAQLMNFRRQFYNTISGTQNAWRTPIVAGLDEVQWVPMSGTAREMEYINFNNHLLRIICAQFQIDPVELGLDYLASANGRAPMQQANNEYKINYSRERGLYPLLMFIEDMVNSDLLPALDNKLAKKYKFVFTGYTDETPQSEISQIQSEMAAWKTMNDVLIQSQKAPIDTPAANLPLSAAFWALVEKNYTRGEIREIFFGDKGASKRRELQYIPGDAAFLPWTQMVLSIDSSKEQKKEQQNQAELQHEQQQKEDARQEAAHNREEEKHKMEIDSAKNAEAANAVKSSLKEAAHKFGASRAINVGGKMIANPINKLDDEE